jgi:hypothetical protein
MQRLPNWPRRLHLLVESSQAVTFDWGSYNCGLFVARWIRECTGVDLGAAYVGKCSNEASAEALFLGNSTPSPAALGDFAAAIAAANGMPEVAPTFARRGDVVWVDNLTQYGALGVVSLDGRFAVCMSEQGTKRVHMQRWRRAWRVG